MSSVRRPDGAGSVTVTAVRADHGPPEVAAKNGPVIGFVLRGDGLPTMYVSGDNASVDVVRGIVADHGPFDAVVLFIGGACVPEAWGDAQLTLTAQTAVEAARELGDAPIAPIHQDGWAHFTSSAEPTSSASSPRPACRIGCGRCPRVSEIPLTLAGFFGAEPAAALEEEPQRPSDTTRLPTPQIKNTTSDSSWSVSHLKFIPKKPVMNVSGRNTVAITVSCLLVSF